MQVSQYKFIPVVLNPLTYPKCLGSCILQEPPSSICLPMDFNPAPNFSPFGRLMDVHKEQGLLNCGDNIMEGPPYQNPSDLFHIFFWITHQGLVVPVSLWETLIVLLIVLVLIVLICVFILLIPCVHVCKCAHAHIMPFYEIYHCG